MKVLVLGGTRYFGLDLISCLSKKNNEIFVSSRRQANISYGNEVCFIKGDRTNSRHLEFLATHGPFDIVFDQICMTGLEAEMAVNAFKGNCKRYVFTSTGLVYDIKNDLMLTENDFDYKKYPVDLKDASIPSYQEGKRQAEAIFGNQDELPVVMVRLPIVLGINDYTERLKFLVQKISREEDLYFPRLATAFSFIEQEEAGNFLNFIGESSFKGAINATSNGTIKIAEILRLIEQATGKKAKLSSTPTQANQSHMGSPMDFIMSNSLASSLGFSFKELHGYLPDLIEDVLQEI